MVFGLLPMAEAQSSDGGSGHRIVFSSPDGQITSNAPVPMVQAPAPRESPNLPAGEVTVHEFADPLDAAMYPQPLPVLQQPNAQNPDDFRNSTDVRKEMGLLTPGQIMNVPTPEQIFGLPEKTLNAQQELSQSENGATNDFTFATNGMFAEPAWATLWANKAPGSTGSSNATSTASGFFGRFFESAGNDDVFGNHDGNSDNQSSLGASQPEQQSSWGSALADGVFTHQGSDGETAPGDFAPPQPGPELTSQSPFAAPQVSTLDALPKVPSLPSLPGQNDKFAQPASTPSWAPKPPPWTQSQPAMGTPVPFNQALNR